MNNRKTSAFTFLLAAFVFAAIGAFGATYRIPAPGGVGDVTALTNAVAQLNKGNTTGARILLEPGVYDLRGTATVAGKSVHLYFNTRNKGGLVAGLGDKPGDTILLGGGETEKKTVLYIWSTDPADPTTVSNLTVTGGYTTGDAGGVFGSTYGGLVLRDVIVSNNYAKGLAGGVLRAKMYNCLIADNTAAGTKNGGGFWSDTDNMGAQDCVFSNNATTATGGGFCSSGANGFLVNCKFYDNSAASASGAYMGGNGLVSNCVFRGNAPTVAASSNKRGGGLYLASGTCTDCVFDDNAADCGGGIYVNGASAVVRNSLFVGNHQTGWASGAAIFVNASSPLALVSNCVFNANDANHESSRTVISNADLVDCVITNHAVTSGYVLAGCNMTRCLFAYNSSTGNGQHVDIGTAYNTTPVSRTNANSIIAHNRAMGVNSLTYGKKIVNCTYADNYCDSGNYGAVFQGGAAWNSIFARNTISSKGVLDVRRYYHEGGVAQLSLTNCVFTAADVAVDSDGLSGCKKVSSLKFEPTEAGGEYDIGYSSPARDAGVWESWMVPLIGTKDFAGRPRIRLRTIDAGAFECPRWYGLYIEVH